MTNGASTPRTLLTDRNSDGFKALRSLVASGTHHRGSGFAAAEGRALLDWVRSRVGSHASWESFWEHVDAVLPTDAREEVTAKDMRLYSAAALLGYIDGIDYETPIPNGKGLKFGEVRTRGAARRGDRRPSVRDRELDYKTHGVARKAFIIALCKPGAPEDLTEKSSDIREITYALAEKLESWTHPATQMTAGPPPAAEARGHNVGGAVIDPAPAPTADTTEPRRGVENSETIVDSEPGAALTSPDAGHERAVRDSLPRWRGAVFKDPRCWWIASALVVTGALIAAGLVIPRMAHPPSVELQLISAPAPRTVDEIDWTSMPSFWLPATDAFSGFPEPPVFDCHDPDIRSWLAANGQLQTGVTFRVRNLDPEEPLSLERIILRGENTPAEPGFVFGCTDGGKGGDDGEIVYSFLSLTARDQALAGFIDRKATDFQRTVAPSSVAGIAIYLGGEEDFEGTLTLDSKFGTDAIQPYFVPDADDSQQPLRVVYHGIPEKNLVKILVGTDGTLSCKSDETFVQPCTLAQARQIVSRAWEDK